MHPAAEAQNDAYHRERQAQQRVTAKDIVLYIISKISASGGTGHFIEFAGEAIRDLSMEERMTVCNMSIEAARAAASSPPTKRRSTT